MKVISEKEKKMCLGKIKHRSKLAADFELESLFKAKRTPDKAELEVYECHFCKHYHIGHSKDIA